MLKDYLPQFKQVEPENLKGLYAGDIVAQRPVAYASSVYGVPTVQKGTVYFIENGILCGLNALGQVVSFDDVANKSTHVLLHYTEELPTVLVANDTFAVKAEEDETYLRLVVLHAGDEFVTDNFDASIAPTGVYGKIVSGIIQLQAAANADTKFAILEDTLADGKSAVRAIYLG